MFTYLSNWVWGNEEETDAACASDALEMDHLTHEEKDDWVVISNGVEQPAEKSKSGEFLFITPLTAVLQFEYRHLE